MFGIKDQIKISFFLPIFYNSGKENRRKKVFVNSGKYKRWIQMLFKKETIYNKKKKFMDIQDIKKTYFDS